MNATQSITVTKAAETLGVSARRVRQLVEAGRIRGEQLNARCWLLSAQDVASYAASDRRPGRPRSA